MKNKYKCPLKNKIKNDLEVVDVTAHNIVCQLVWNGSFK